MIDESRFNNGSETLENIRKRLIEKHGKENFDKAREKVSLKSLFENYDGDYVPKEYDWGESKGKEI